MYLRRFRLSLEETKAYFDCVNCSCRNKMSYELARWTHDDVRVISSTDFLLVPDLRSFTMLSTLPLFNIAQSVNSDDLHARFQGLRVIMCSYCTKDVTECSQAIVSAAKEVKASKLTIRESLRKIKAAFLSTREVSAQECVYRCMPELWLKKVFPKTVFVTFVAILKIRCN